YMNFQHTNTPYKVPTFELRLSSNDDGSLGGGVGAFYTKQTGTTVVNQRADTFFSAFLPTNVFLPIGVDVIVPVDSETLSFNAFGHARVGNLRIEGGLRYTKVKSVRVTDVNISSPGFAPFFIAPFAFSQVGVPAA